MIDPYRMVVVNVIAVVSVLVGLIVFKLIYPQKKLNLFYLLIILSLLPLLSLLRFGTYESGDMSINAYKSMAFYDSLSQGILLPRWAGDLNATLGYPLFIFTYPLPYYIISFFHFLGFSFISSIKLLIAVCFITSGITMYLWVREEINKFAAFIASIFYLYAPYHLIDMHFRVSIGEVVSFVLIPLNFFFISKFFKTRELIYVSCLTIALSFTLLANQAIALIAFPITIAYIVFQNYKAEEKDLKLVLFCLGAIVLSLTTSAFYWIPAISELKYTHASKYVETISFLKLSDLLYSPYRFGFLFQGPKGELATILGYTQLSVVIILMLQLVKNKLSGEYFRMGTFFVSLFFIFTFMMTPFSKPVWDNISALRNFQFTYRLLLFTSLFAGFSAGIVSTRVNKKVMILLCAATLSYTLLNWGNRRTLPEIGDGQLIINLSHSTFQGEGFQPAAPEWVDPKNPWTDKIPNDHLEVLSGMANIKELKRTINEHHYEVNATTTVTLGENTLYFPGWNLQVNGEKYSLGVSETKNRGTIRFELPEGKHKVDFTFQDTNIRTVSKQISGIGFLILASLISLGRVRPKF